MALLDLWQGSPEEIENKRISQLVRLAGDGKLRDDSETSRELRAYLSKIPTAQLKRYVAECLANSFDESGLVLQDLVNELGSRIGCFVAPGRYRGTVNAIGFDGLWKFPSGFAVVVEVKTTDAYTIRLDKIADYRGDLIKDGQITGDSSMLIVVGRKDTESLEAQVRGSRHAWDIRLISADKLVRLVEIKEEADDKETINKIQTVLQPLELTRVDFIVDLLAATAEDIQEGQKEEEAEPDVHETGGKKFTPVSFNRAVVAAAAQFLGVNVKKETRTLYLSEDKKVAIRGLVSKTHEQGDNKLYWFAFHPHFLSVLDDYESSYVAFGCGSAAKTILFKVSEIYGLREKLNKTEKEDRFYWHIHLKETRSGEIYLTFKGGARPLDVTGKIIQLPDAAG